MHLNDDYLWVLYDLISKLYMTIIVRLVPQEYRPATCNHTVTTQFRVLCCACLGTFEATDVLDAVFGAMHARAALRMNVGRIETLEPFAALERRRGIGGIAHVTIDRQC